MGGWYRCEFRHCNKTADEEWAVIIVNEGIRHVYCSKECAEADGFEVK